MMTFSQACLEHKPKFGRSRRVTSRRLGPRIAEAEESFPSVRKIGKVNHAVSKFASFEASNFSGTLNSHRNPVSVHTGCQYRESLGACARSRMVHDLLYLTRSSSPRLSSESLSACTTVPFNPLCFPSKYKLKISTRHRKPHTQAGSQAYLSRQTQTRRRPL